MMEKVLVSWVLQGFTLWFLNIAPKTKGKGFKSSEIWWVFPSSTYTPKHIHYFHALNSCLNFFHRNNQIIRICRKANICFSSRVNFQDWKIYGSRAGPNQIFHRGGSILRVHPDAFRTDVKRDWGKRVRDRWLKKIRKSFTFSSAGFTRRLLACRHFNHSLP